MTKHKIPTHAVETVTPEQARAWLSENNIDCNRNLIAARVTQYSNDMGNGDWYVCQPLLFTEDGTLIDGQNRLSAVVQAGVPTNFLILRGVDEKAFHAIDTGKSRTTADIAKMMGKVFVQDHISCFNSMYCAPGLSSSNLSNFSKKQTIEKMESIKEALIFACKGHGSKVKGQLNHSVINAVVARAFFYEDDNRLYDFLTSFRTGFSNGEKDSAAIALRNVYLANKNAQNRTLRSVCATRNELFLYAQSALVHFIKGNHLQNLRLPKVPKNVWHVESIDGPKKKK